MNFDLDEGIAILSRTPRVLDVGLRDLPPAWLEATEGAGMWSPRDVVGHLIHGEDTDWIPRARIILEHGADRTFEPFDRFAQFERFAAVPIGELLDRFAARRAVNLETLRGWRLTGEQLALGGRHPDFGPVTLGQLLATWVAHDLNHIGQIARVMAKRLAGDVGPWKAYLGILRDS